MTEYIADLNTVTYYAGTVGSATDHIAGTFPSFGRCDFEWSGDFTDPSIVGFKLVFDASAGDGYMFWDWTMGNPGPPSGWTADPGATHIAVDNSYAGDDSAIRVDGPTHYEWRFYWPGDPTFGGFVFNDPLSDLLISLRESVGAPLNFSEVFGEINATTVTTPIVVTRFDLVLLTRAVAPPCHLYPRDDDQGVGTGAIWPPPSSGRPGSYY